MVAEGRNSHPSEFMDEMKWMNFFTAIIIVKRKCTERSFFISLYKNESFNARKDFLIFFLQWILFFNVLFLVLQLAFIKIGSQ